MKTSTKVLALSSLVVSLVVFAAVEGNYQKYQRPMKYSDLTLEAKGEHHRISLELAAMRKVSAQEDNENFDAYKEKGDFRGNKKSLILDKEYQSLANEMKILLNPPSRKTEGFGYEIYKFLGVIK